MTARDELLRRSPGVYRLTVPTADLAAAGWRVVRITATTKAGALDEFARDLDFPAYFGRNLDALLDCLRGVPGPVAVVLSRWRDFQAAHPREWAALLGVLELRAAEPGFAVILPG